MKEGIGPVSHSATSAAVLLPIRERTLAGYHNAPFRIVMPSIPAGHTGRSAEPVEQMGDTQLIKLLLKLLKPVLPIFAIHDEPVTQVGDVSQLIQCLIDSSEPNLPSAISDDPSNIPCVLDPEGKAIFPIGFQNHLNTTVTLQAVTVIIQVAVSKRFLAALKAHSPLALVLPSNSLI